MKTVYKTKKVTPLIFDYYPDTYLVDLGRSIEGVWNENKHVSNHYPTQAELNRNFNNYTQDKLNRFHLKESVLTMGRGVMFDNYYFDAIIYTEDGELRGAITIRTIPNCLSTGKQILVNKFFKFYGIKLRDITLMDYNAFIKKFVFPVSFGINDLNEDLQRDLSSEFLSQERAKKAIYSSE